MSSLPIRAYANSQIAARLATLAFEVQRAGRKPGEAAVHDLRVAIRRFSQSLRIFCTLLPGRPRKIGRKLRQVMRAAAAVRDLDIAGAIVAQSKVPGTAALRKKIAADRKEAASHLAELLRALAKREFTTRWRQRLELDAS